MLHASPYVRRPSFRARAAAEEGGFTAIELVIALAIMAVAVTLTATAFLNFWRVRALEGAGDVLTAQLRELQQRSTAETHPLVYGARFSIGSSQYGLIRFDPRGPGTLDDTCTQFATRELSSGLFQIEAQVKDMDFVDGPESTFCKANLKNGSGVAIPAGADEFVFFYARGSATGGVLVLMQDDFSRTRSLSVRDLTGKVVEI